MLKNGCLDRTAVVAGSGRLPFEIITALLDQGHRPFLILLKDNIDKYLYTEAILSRCNFIEIAVTDISLLLQNLKNQHIVNIVLAGGVISRPKLQAIRYDFHSFFGLIRLLPSLSRGDDALLKAFIKFLESYGFNVLAAQDIVPNLLAPSPCVLTKLKPSRKEQRNLSISIEAAKALGKLDIGQAAVAVGGRVIALEGAEGTDNMLMRIAQMRQEKRIAEIGGILVKVAKPGQELRVDLPTIGLDTLQRVYECGLSGIAVEAERSLILNKAELINKANEHAMFICSFKDPA